MQNRPALGHFSIERCVGFFADLSPEVTFDLVTCISGIMCLDGWDRLLENFSRHLKPQGLLVITNDNVMTVRDRLSFLLWGHFRRFKLLMPPDEGNWNVVVPQALALQLERKNLVIKKVIYTSFYAEDLIFLPLVAVLYPLFAASFLIKKSHWPRSLRLQLFPWQSLLARHYVIVAEKVLSP